MARAGAELLADAELITPVPLHRLRLLKRGYTQAAVLARALAREAGVVLVPDLLQRRRYALAAGAERQARLENVTAGAVPRAPVAPRARRGQARGPDRRRADHGRDRRRLYPVLRRAGASQVDVLTLARVVRDAATPV